MTGCDAHHCVTCADEAVSMQIRRIDFKRGLALCADAHGTAHTVEIALVGPVDAGDRVLVHAGVALAAERP